MKLLTLDLEMNKNAKGETKIIQIGYVICDTRKDEPIAIASLLINPQEPIDPFIVELTGITDELASSGMTLLEAYNLMVADIKKYGASTLPAQWGIGDTNLLREQLGLKWDEYVFKHRAIDVKSVFQAYAAFNGGRTKVGLSSAMKVLGLTFQGRAHSADADAFNTYLTLKELTGRMNLSDKIRKVMEEK